MPDVDLADDLAALARALRAQLARHAAAGRWAAPGGASPRTAGDPIEEPLEIAEDSAADAGERRRLPQIREELGECTRCKLHGTRRSIVFGAESPR